MTLLKKMTGFGTAALLAFGLAACNSDDAKTTMSKHQEQKQRPVTLLTTQLQGLIPVQDIWN